MKPFSNNANQARWQRVFEYIDTHLSGELSIDMLSGVAAYSKFHFHRQFSALFGVTVSKYIQLKRLKRASYQLAYRETSITEIAFDCCYESPEAFSRAFKQFFEQAPSDFRKKQNWDFWLTIYEPIAKIRIVNMAHTYSNEDIEIVAFSETRIAVFEHVGDPKGILGSVRKFISWRKENGLAPSRSATFNILHDNPNEVKPSDYRFDICAEIHGTVSANDYGVVEKVIPAGLCAKLRYIGSYDQLENAVSYIYGEWLPKSSMEPRDFPLFLQRVKFFPDVPEHEAITDIFLPLT